MTPAARTKGRSPVGEVLHDKPHKAGAGGLPLRGPMSVMGSPVIRMTSGRVLARNTVWNLLGLVAPLLVALFAIPLLVHGLGTERFGILTLAWMVVSYFSLFDLGLGRALTMLVAEKLGREREIPALVWTALVLMLVFGLAGGLLVAFLAPLLVHAVLNIPEALHAETLQAFYLLALSVPIMVTTAGLRGILEAQQRFGLVNAVRGPMGAFIFVGPLMVLPFSRSLVPVVGVLLAGRIVAWLVYLLLCFRVMPSLRTGMILQRAAVKPLVSFGSWMTVTSTISPLMVYLDRFFIGAVFSMAAVAYYATPYEMVTKLSMIPTALVGVLFPAFSANLMRDRARAARLFDRGVTYLLVVLFPLTLLIVTLAHNGLDLWLGSEFARHSTTVLQLLAVGVFINSLGHVPFALVQGAGRPDLTAKLNLIEVPFYLIILWWLIRSHGIEGAAVAWTARMTVDALCLFVMARRFVPDSASLVRRMALTFGLALIAFAGGGYMTGGMTKALFLSLALPLFVSVAWFVVLSSEDRALARNYLKAVSIFGQGLQYRLFGTPPE